MKCPRCQFENPAAANFCMKCAQDLRASREDPTTDYTRPQTYTPQFLIDKILTTKSTVEGERKTVTVLFADVANYTLISGKLDPEQVHKVMDGCFKILMKQIHNHEGTINQFTGDGVMALFGAPVAHEDHAQRACLAALGIQEALKGYGNNLNKKLGIDFKMRIGLNSGPVVVGSIGDDLRMDYTAIGDTTNLASRMEGMAQPGTTLISQNTYKIVNQGFKCKSLGKRTVKGKEGPVEIFKLEAGQEVYKPRVGLERQVFSEMVGRNEDLEKLELQMRKAVNGEGSVVSIIGEAGIGKSRLMAELKRREVTKSVTLLEGRAISIGRNLSFHPITDLLKHWAGIKEDGTEADALSKLEAAIRTVCQEDTDEILPFAAILMGMKLTGKQAERVNGIEGEALEKLILKNMRDLLIRAAEMTPLLIVMEDLHWADTSSIELLESLFRLTESQGIIFVTVFRPDHKETSDRILKALQERRSIYHVAIRLAPLNEKESEALINNMMSIKGLQHRIKDQIIGRSGGNPFFIEEVVRSFIDEGAVVKTNGAFEATDKLNQMVIPHTINDVLMARIDRLEEKTRNLVKIASVIGRNFFYRILAELSNAIEDIEVGDDMDSRLTYLKEIQLIRDRKRLEEIEYLFKHALAQEAAYESILIQKRKSIHLKVAEAIEKVFHEKLHEFYGMLAYHYSQGKDYEKTEHYLIKAGEEALRSSASSEALNYYQQGLALYLQFRKDDIDPEKVAMFEKNIGIAYLNKSRWVEAIEHIDKVFQQWKIATSPNIIVFFVKLIIDFISITTGLYRLFEKRKPPPNQRDIEIIDLIYKKVQASAFIDNTKLFFIGLSGLNRALSFELKSSEQVTHIMGTASIFTYSGLSHRFANRLLELVRPKMENMNDIKISMVYLFCLTLFKHCSGSWKQWGAYEQGAVKEALKAGVLYEASNYIWCYSMVKSEKGHFEETKILIEKLSEIGISHNYDLATVGALVLKADLMSKKGRWSKTGVIAQQGLTSSRQGGTDLHELIFASYRAEALFLQNDLHGTKECIAQAKRIMDQHKFIPPTFIAPFLVTQFVIDIGFLKKAMESKDVHNLSQLRKKARKSGQAALKKLRKYAPYRTKVLRLMGEYYWLIGKQRQAFKWWNKAIREGERLGARVDLSLTYFEAGKALFDPKSNRQELNRIKAEEYLEKARPMFEEMDLQYDMEELKRISAFN